ncbi:MAG: type I methionyl aminopeptidase [Anaerolineales bacterium]|jgi:methionyl aminopeptidase
MTLDSDKDLEALKRIGHIVAQTLEEMRRHVLPGVSTGELDHIGETVLHTHGAKSAPVLVYNFPGTTCISLNDEAAHGIPGSRVVQPGDLVNLDVSAELDGYFADAAVTVAVPPVSPLQARLINCTHNALQKGMRAARSNRPLNVIGRAVEREARRCGFFIIPELGGHGVGRSIHEKPRMVPNFYDPADHRRLREGMVITIEPFLTPGSGWIFTAEDGWTLKTKDGSLSVQFEHTVVITRGRPIVVTTL